MRPASTEMGAPPDALERRPHSKHSARSLPWRRHWRPARRAALSLRWARSMAQVNHSVASMWRAFFAKRLPEITGQAPRLRKGVPGWKSFKKAQRRAVSR